MSPFFTSAFGVICFIEICPFVSLTKRSAILPELCLYHKDSVERFLVAFVKCSAKCLALTKRFVIEEINSLTEGAFV
jgi:hypothetical protein